MRLLSPPNSHVKSNSQIKHDLQVNPTPKSTQLLSRWQTRVDSNVEVDLESQIKLNQIKDQMEAQQIVKVNIGRKVKRGAFLYR